MRGESAGGVGAPWFDEGMDADAAALREQSRALWATVACFVLGALASGLLLYGVISLGVAWLGFSWFQKTRKGFADVL